MGRASGFTLVELLVASVLASLVAMGAFAALSSTQLTAAVQQRAVDRVARARLAMELIGRDVRSAGDAVNYLPDWCLGNQKDASSEWACPAILDAHPWRLTIARNAWLPGADGIPDTTDDVPNTTVAFNANRENVVTYEFRPAGGKQKVGDREYFRGQLVRIEDPFSFGGAGSKRETLLLDDVVVDNRMVVDPANPSDHDERFDFALFTYRLLSNGSGEFQGDDAIVARATKQGVFLLPPVRFFDAGAALPALNSNTPFRPDYGTPSFAGTKGKGKGKALGLRKGHTSAADAAADYKFVLDHNRIRAVRIAFKAIVGTDEASRTDGIDTSAARPGTAPVVPFESTFDLELFSSYLVPRSRT